MLTSNGAQAYLDTGVVTLKVAQDAGEVLDGIVAGEITSDSISNKKIDRLKTTEQFGRKAVSSVLGVEVKRASSASAQRAAVREAIRTFEQNNAQQNVVATAQNQAQQRETPLGMEFDAQNSIPAMMQQNAVDSVGMPTMQQTAPETATQETAPATATQQTASEIGTGTVGNARAVPQAQVSAQNGKVSTGQVESNTEMRAATRAVSNVHGDANTAPMSYKEFKYRMKNDKEFRNRYAPSNKNLSEEERNTIAYDTYLTQEQAKTNSDRADTVQHSVKDNQYGVERNEYSEKLDQKVVSAIDALAKLFHLKVRFGDLGGNNGLYHADTGLIELDIDPQHSGASNGFLFSVSHEIGHAVKARIGAKAWEEFADYAVKAKSGEKTIKAKQESATEYSEYKVAREEVVCDFIGELLSEQKTLDTFCESIKSGEINAETARGIVAAWRKITGILRGKGVKQTDTATAALVQRVQEQFNTDIETAENAVRKMQKALSAAMKVETQNKNAAETGDAMFNKKNNTKMSATSPLSGSPATQGSVGKTLKSITAAAEHLGIKVNLSQVSDYVKSAIAVFSDVLDAISNNTPVRGSKHNISAGNIVGILIDNGVLKRGGTSGSAYRTDENRTLRISNHSARADNFTTDGENLSVVLLKTNKINDFVGNDNADVIEVQFKKDYLDKNPEVFKNLVKDIARFVVTGEYHDTAGAKRYNISGSEEFRTRMNKRLAEDEEARKVMRSKKDKHSSSVQTQEDATYISLAEKYRDGTATVEETEQLQKMVDEAAKAAGYSVRAYHGTQSGGFTEFTQADDGYSYWFTDRENVSESYAGGENGIYKVCLDLGKSLYVDAAFSKWNQIVFNGQTMRTRDIVDYAHKNGYDSVHFENVIDIGKNGSKKSEITAEYEEDAIEIEAESEEDAISQAISYYEDQLNEGSEELGRLKFQESADELVAFYETDEPGESIITDIRFTAEKIDRNVFSVRAEVTESVGQSPATVYAVFDGKQVKSAEAVTYDDNGNVIPLSERFNTDKTNIRYSKKDKPRRIVPTPEEAKALDERLKAREEEKAAQKRKERDETIKRLVYTSPGFAPYRSAKDNLSSMADEYGRIPQGESPARDVTVPVSTDGETKVRRTVRTAMEAEATPKEMIPHIEESIVEGNFNYKQKKNAKTMEAAREWVERRGDVTKAYEDWISEKNRRLNADMIARGFIIYNNLSNAYVNAKTETERTALREKAISILQDISVMGTVAGQTAQAIRLLKQQSPESQYYALERSVRKLQDGINERYGDKQNDAPKIEIDKERAAKWIQALREGDMDLAYDLEEVLFQQIAKQIPKTLSDRLNAWRYLSMLGNPKTLIRNAVGNAAFTPITMAKDQIGALMEKLLPKEQRTKYFGSLHASKEGRALLKFASEDALSSDVQQMMERNKYDDTNVNDRLARAVSERRSTFDAPVLKQWQAATRYMMEKMPGMGDEFYKGIHYRRAFAGAAMARGYTVADFTSGRVSETELIKLRTYATNQAMKATFNDANKFSDLVSRMHTKSKVVNTAIEGTLPFKRTPANVAVRSFEYSPVAMIRSLTTDLYALKTGKITGQEYIEHLAQGVTGTVMFGLGWLAAATGIVRVGADDDDEREGRQSYSLELFGESITLDWLAPTSVAFFMGAEARELFSDRDIGESFLDAAIDAGSNIFAPVLEMTALSGAKDLLDTFVYSYNKDGADAGQIVLALFVQPFLSYLGQFAPTAFGQFENMFEPYRTTTYVGDIQGTARL